jgi:hypothetical protein
VILLAREFVIGAVGGIAVGLAAAALLRRLPLPSAGLAPVSRWALRWPATWASRLRADRVF